MCCCCCCCCSYVCVLSAESSSCAIYFLQYLNKQMCKEGIFHVVVFNVTHKNIIHAQNKMTESNYTRGSDIENAVMCQKAIDIRNQKLKFLKVYYSRNFIINDFNLLQLFSASWFVLRVIKSHASVSSIRNVIDTCASIQTSWLNTHLKSIINNFINSYMTLGYQRQPVSNNEQVLTTVFFVIESSNS